MTKYFDKLMTAVIVISICAVFVYRSIFAQEEPVPAPEPAPVHHAADVHLDVVIKDEAAMLRRCDVILKDKYGLAAADRKAILYVEDVPDLKRCLEYIVIDVLSPPHSSLTTVATVEQRTG